MFKFLRELFDIQTTPLAVKPPKEEPWNWETDNPEKFAESKAILDIVMRDLEKYPPHEWTNKRAMRFGHPTFEKYSLLDLSKTQFGIVYKGGYIWLIKPHAESLAKFFYQEQEKYEKIKSTERIKEFLTND